MKRLLTQRSIIQWKQYTLPDTLISLYIMQAVEMIKNGVRLSPPPGCPRAIYELMIQCWWVCIVYVIFAYITIAFRHPEASGRFLFDSALQTLSTREPATEVDRHYHPWPSVHHAGGSSKDCLRPAFWPAATIHKLIVTCDNNNYYCNYWMPTRNVEQDGLWCNSTPTFILWQKYCYWLAKT